MADPAKSRAAYMKNYRKVKRHQKRLEDESLHDFNDGLPYPEEVVDVHMSTDSDVSGGCDSGQALELSDESSDLDYQYLSLDDISTTYEYSSSSEDDETVVSAVQQQKTKQFLCDWAIKSKPSVEALNSLLHHLNTFMPLLPKTGVTLKETEHIKGVAELCGGQYLYIGVKEALYDCLQGYPNVKKLDMIINVDGVKCYSSKKMSLWPTLTMINGTGPYLVSVWYGPKKPTDVDMFLSDFIKEMKLLLADGYRGINVSLKYFICDAPARAFLKCTVNHNAYFACERCTAKGTYNRGVRLINIDAQRRTDEEFARESYHTHQHKLSPLCKLNFPMVSGFLLDTMHLVFLGVVKKMLTMWTTTHGPPGVRLSRTVIDGISLEMKNIADFMPSKFQRKSRELDCIDVWKAVEFRFFILYAAPAVMKGKLPDKEYNLLVSLSVALHIILSDTHCKDDGKVAYAERLLNAFVLEYTEIYGEDNVTYNTHNLVHLADDVRNCNEALNTNSAFPFESCLGHITKSISGPKYPVQQIVNKYNEKRKLLKTAPECRQRKSTKRYKRMPLKRDSVFHISANKFVIIEEIVTETELLCRVVNHGHDWFSVPLPSTDINYCYKPVLSSCQTKVYSSDELVNTAMMMPVHSGHLFTPLLHTL